MIWGGNDNDNSRARDIRHAALGRRYHPV